MTEIKVINDVLYGAEDLLSGKVFLDMHDKPKDKCIAFRKIIVTMFGCSDNLDLHFTYGDSEYKNLNSKLTIGDTNEFHKILNFLRSEVIKVNSDYTVPTSLRCYGDGFHSCKHFECREAFLQLQKFNTPIHRTISKLIENKPSGCIKKLCILPHNPVIDENIVDGKINMTKEVVEILKKYQDKEIKCEDAWFLNIDNLNDSYFVLSTKFYFSRLNGSMFNMKFNTSFYCSYSNMYLYKKRDCDLLSAEINFDNLLEIATNPNKRPRVEDDYEEENKKKKQEEEKDLLRDLVQE